jgi:hypothetical protein
MGLAAGINFSLRSVTLAADSYRRDYAEQALRPDEILQMHGRAGRRGIDEVGYVLVNQNELRMHDAHAAHLARSGMVDWNALLGLMTAAAAQGRDPFTEAVRVQERLFTTKPILLGVEESMKNPVVPCGLKTDAERARHVRKRVRQMLNSRGEWEVTPAPVEKKVGEVRVMEPIPESALNLLKLRDAGMEMTNPQGSGTKSEDGSTTSESASSFAIGHSSFPFHPLLSSPDGLEKIGQGILCVVGDEDEQKTYGRSTTVAERAGHDRVQLVKWVRRLTASRKVTPRSRPNSVLQNSPCGCPSMPTAFRSGAPLSARWRRAIARPARWSRPAVRCRPAQAWPCSGAGSDSSMRRACPPAGAA